MGFLRPIFYVLCMGFLHIGWAQQCSLDVGGEHNQMIIEVFQLNESQIEVMEMLRETLVAQKDKIQEEVQQLFDTHPQNNEEELMKLADKYRVLQSRLAEALQRSDEALLATFNERQYERYLVLCHEAVRIPYRVQPVPMPKDTVGPE